MAIDLQTAFCKMLKHCENAEKYTEGISFEAFVQNELYLTFTVFSLSQLGELAAVLDNRTDCRQQFPDLPWTAMKSLRNNIVHDYDGLRFSVIWSTVKEDLPVLKAQIKSIISRLE